MLRIARGSLASKRERKLMARTKELEAKLAEKDNVIGGRTAHRNSREDAAGTHRA